MPRGKKSKTQPSGIRCDRGTILHLAKGASENQGRAGADTRTAARGRLFYIDLSRIQPISALAKPQWQEKTSIQFDANNAASASRVETMRIWNLENDDTPAILPAPESLPHTKATCARDS
jgi:hypothetical protein